MQEEVITELIEWNTTTYSCDREGCDFTTEDKSESEKHYGKAHSIQKVDWAAGHSLYQFDTKENFDAYVKAEYFADHDIHWHEPGWYRAYTEWRPCGRGCCSRDHRVIEPASWIGMEWQREIKELTEKLTELATFLGEDGEFLLEDD